jgi:hypothetical protein
MKKSYKHYKHRWETPEDRATMMYIVLGFAIIFSAIMSVKEVLEGGLFNIYYFGIPIFFIWLFFYIRKSIKKEAGMYKISILRWDGFNMPHNPGRIFRDMDRTLNPNFDATNLKMEIEDLLNSNKISFQTFRNQRNPLYLRSSAFYDIYKLQDWNLEIMISIQGTSHPLMMLGPRTPQNDQMFSWLQYNLTPIAQHKWGWLAPSPPS